MDTIIATDFRAHRHATELDLSWVTADNPAVHRDFDEEYDLFCTGGNTGDQFGPIGGLREEYTV